MTLKKGANQMTVTLPLAGLNEQVIVRTSTDDLRGNSFTSVAQRRRRSPSCPTTPTSCSRCWMQMAGPGATMRVNGFTGGRLPPKSQIRSIRFRMNSFAPTITKPAAASASTSSPSRAWTTGAG